MENVAAIAFFKFIGGGGGGRGKGGGGAVEDVLRGKAVLGGLKKGTQVDLDGEKRGGRQEERVQQ